MKATKMTGRTRRTVMMVTRTWRCHETSVGSCSYTSFLGPSRMVLTQLELESLLYPDQVVAWRKVSYY